MVIGIPKIFFFSIDELNGVSWFRGLARSAGMYTHRKEPFCSILDCTQFYILNVVMRMWGFIADISLYLKLITWKVDYFLDS